MRNHEDLLRRSRGFGLLLGFGILGLTAASVAGADGGVTYVNRAAELGIDYARVESPRNAIYDEFRASGITVPDDLGLLPHKAWGAPGVAILDYDGDGDLDLYVTNGPGAPNSLYSSQLVETGTLAFVDVAAAAGVAATDQDSSGVCFGDVDNDGDPDLMVLGAIEPNRFFENQGDGTFADVSATAGLGGGDLSTSSCAMGDVDNDGLLDIVVANTHTSWVNQLGIVEPFVWNEHNQLFVNQGGNVFTERGAEAGLQDLPGLPAGAAGLTWAVAAVDLDEDGDVDLLFFDDQGAIFPPILGGIDYGLIHLFENDGTGSFTGRTIEAGLAAPGNWMGASFGDFDCNGRLDFFATNVGDLPAGGLPIDLFPPSFRSSRWFLQQDDGTFADPGVGALEGTPFGWGTSAFDYDNDGDFDVVYHGAIDAGVFLDAGNPGVILQNPGCTAAFTYDDAWAAAVDHARRGGQGLAAGDLDHNGFVDLVSVANWTLPADAPLLRNPPVTGGVFDETAFYAPNFVPTDVPGEFTWTGLELQPGDLTVDMAQGNGNGWIEVETLGTVGLVTGARANRDGIGAVVSYYTEGGKRGRAPVLGGASYASQDSLAVEFGLGEESRATVEVLWPGGVRNRLRGVAAGERVTFPEIPCDVGDEVRDRAAYRRCVEGALDELAAAGLVDNALRDRLFESAFACAGPGLCLQDRRFQVTATWGGANPARPVPGASDVSGNLWFFDPENWEVLVKVLDGCAVNGHYWVFASAATDVEYALRVTDTETGAERVYRHPAGTPAPAITDTSAFATCP